MRRARHRLQPAHLDNVEGKHTPPEVQYQP
jgi:hypothetical protein